MVLKIAVLPRFPRNGEETVKNEKEGSEEADKIDREAGHDEDDRPRKNQRIERLKAT